MEISKLTSTLSFLLWLLLIVVTQSFNNIENSTKVNSNDNTINTNRNKANKQITPQDREAEGRYIAKRTLKLGSTENCEIWSDPMSILKGNLCGGGFYIHINQSFQLKYNK
jgi:hypothetical protein